MRIKITARSERPVFFPYNYNYALQSALYALIRESSEAYSEFLHDKGYVKDGINKLFKLFTFSKLNFLPQKRGSEGFHSVREIQFIFSTIIEKSMEHLILGIFSDKTMRLNLNGQNHFFEIINVDMKADTEFKEKQKFICQSPITVSTMILNEDGEKKQHFLNYMLTEEREHFIQNLKNNLINKYETVNDIPYKNHDIPFNFSFDTEYIVRKNGRISKLIEFKDRIKIKAMEAPFIIEADPALIKIGYECGFGEKNSAGFGCVESI